MCCTARPWEIIRSFTVEMMHRSMTCWKISISNISATQNTAAPFSTPFWAMLLRFHENDIESILTKDSTGNSVTEILNYLNRHYQSVTLREAAKHFGYSTSHFSTLIKESPEHFMRTFKKTYRMTPGETGRRTGNKRSQDLIYFLYNRCRSGRSLSYPPL